LEEGVFVARIIGPRDVMLTLPNRRGLDLFEHHDRSGPGELFTAEGYATPAAAEELRGAGCTVEVVEDAKMLRARLEKALSQTYPARPVALVVARGPGDLLSDLPGRLGIDPPVYSARPLGEGAWELATEADEAEIAALRAAGAAVEILESPDVLARRRGER
jgi:hypothetical protein